ncbi:hypothetical protein [Pararhizobium antarcticum]|uniref:Uncharacterized protein n=1 Tax=Pararhizobium antarcticum TaxID=1798805 RepID=A0A657LVK1_9HYPH|nr:hypothetical protein [Pararhizobium antarcticum]OJF99384.1 hypothetical protein AX760_12925 [Pararhizobium antarcticum]
MTKHAKLIELISVCTDIGKLQNWVRNAEREGVPEIADAARRRIIEVEALKSKDSSSDSMVLDFWKSIFALEFALSEERGKTTRLNRTRQKIARVGVLKTLADLALQPTASEGYFLLRERGMLDMSAEAVVLRFPDRFGPDVLIAARRRLTGDQDSNPDGRPI